MTVGATDDGDRHDRESRPWVPDPVDPQQFEEALVDLLRQSSRFADTHTPADRGVDLVARGDGGTYLIEAKASIPYTRERLEDSIRQLKDAGRRYTREHQNTDPPTLVLAFPKNLTAMTRETLNAAGIQAWDLDFLARMAISTGTPQSEAILERANAGPRPNDAEYSNMTEGLDSIQPGRKSWMEYESFCEDALALLFSPPLKRPLKQHQTSNRVNRRDFILPNYATEGNWRLLETDYRADHVVVDSKNYAAPIKKESVLQLGNYLNPYGTGLFGLILTRKGLSRSAAWTTREQWTLHKKLIVTINDEELVQMLEAGRIGQDPSELIVQKIEDFRLSI